MADFLGKSKDLSKVTLELTFPAVGTHSFLEAKEINVSSSDLHDLLKSAPKLIAYAT